MSESNLNSKDRKYEVSKMSDSKVEILFIL